jgi:hypothetical protein
MGRMAPDGAEVIKFELLETVEGSRGALERSVVARVERTLILASTTTLSPQDDGLA